MNRAKVHIKKNEEITINYVPPYEDTLTRRQTLKEGWYFECNCKRCADPTEFGAMTSAIKCLVGCGLESAHMVPKDSLDEDTAWICDGCGAATNKDRVDDVMEKVKNEMAIVFDKGIGDMPTVMSAMERIGRPFFVCPLFRKYQSFGFSFSTF